MIVLLLYLHLYMENIQIHIKVNPYNLYNDITSNGRK